MLCAVQPVFGFNIQSAENFWGIGGIAPRLSSRITRPVQSSSASYSLSLNDKPCGMGSRGLPTKGNEVIGWKVPFASALVF